jgi:hypothetical protein
VRPTHDSPGVDHENRPTHESERTENAVGLGHLLVDVGEQGEPESVLVGELIVAVDVLRRDGEHLGIQFLEPGQIVVVAVQLPGADRCVVARIEHHDHRSTSELGQGPGSAGAGERELGCDVAD